VGCDSDTSNQTLSVEPSPTNKSRLDMGHTADAHSCVPAMAEAPFTEPAALMQLMRSLADTKVIVAVCRWHPPVASVSSAARGGVAC